jgi:uncharacterized protein
MDYEGAITHILDRLENELEEHLYYHGGHHTLDVLEAAERIGKHELLSDSELNLLLVAAAYHDSGFLYGHHEHEKRGCELAMDLLPRYGFDADGIAEVCKMIMATKIPQAPTDRLSEILCDADLDYLGRDDFEPIATSLFKELQQLNIIGTIEAWNRIQLGFLQQHHYHTAYGKAVRQPQKQLHLDRVRTIVNGYDR